jgi:hypothetical protein
MTKLEMRDVSQFNLVIYYAGDGTAGLASFQE